MEDYYKMIGTNKQAVDYDINRKKRTYEEKLEFIKEKYKTQMRIIESKKNIARNQNNEEKIEALNAQEEATISAYQQVKSLILEQDCEQSTDKTRQQDYLTMVFNNKTPYGKLNLLEESIQNRTDAENDRMIKNRAEQLLKFYEKQLEGTKNFKEKLRIKTEMQNIQDAYEMIKTADKRKEYKEQNEQKEEERQKAKNIEEKYSHASEFNAYLINNRKNISDKSLQNKIVEKQEKISEESITFIDKNNREIRIRQIGRINFENWTTVNKLFINEFEVKREVNREEKTDIVYINLDFRDFKKSLTLDKETGELINPEYYNCIANELLAEETIEGSKYNGRFLGGIVQDKEGKYHITLESKKLPSMEQEQMAAVIILQQREKNMKEENII